MEFQASLFSILMSDFPSGRPLFFFFSYIRDFSGDGNFGWSHQGFFWMGIL